MVRDPLTGEVFARVVGRRRRAPLGEPPSHAAREALSAMAAYRTRAPKGVFIYRSHEEMEADRERWTAEAIADHQSDG